MTSSPLHAASASCSVSAPSTVARPARVYRPGLPARLLLNRCAARTVIARETADALADHDPPALTSRVGQRIAFADTARTGRLVHQVPAGAIAAREIAAVASEIDGLLP